MTALDFHDYPVRQDEPGFDPSGWGTPIPAMVRTVERTDDEMSDLLDRYGVRRWLLEVTLHEENSEVQTKRFTSEDGAVVEIEPTAAAAAEDGPLPEMLEKVKDRLGIGITHLAAALGVERPTVYAWLKGEQQPQPKRWERIQALVWLAEYWREHSSQPLGRRIFVPAASGYSAMDLLSVEDLDLGRVRKLLERLATDENDRSNRLKEKAVAMRERMKDRGLEPLPDEVVDQTLRDLDAE